MSGEEAPREGQERAGVVARELVSRAARDTFQARAGGADVETIVEYFESGGAIAVGQEAAAAACVMGFETVPGLLELVESVGLASADAPDGVRAAACELVLEALVAEKRVSRSIGGGYSRARHEGPSGGSGLGGGFDPFGKGFQ